MDIKAIIHPAAEGGYWAEVPALPGCITEGDSMEEVTANLKDAILLLERLRQRRLARCCQ
jgi:predicted RNase H-like HicB family nuclease